MSQKLHGKSDRDRTIEVRSNITGGPTEPVFRAKVLGKYDVTFYACRATGYIQTESPYWLDEAYLSAITALDLGLVSRNFDKATITPGIIERSFTKAERFIDYGGGYGMFTRLMRDRGFNFVHYDTHCENLFASNCELSQLDPPPDRPYDLLTAWEVFEHLPSPRDSLNEMLSVADAVLFSTSLVPEKPIRSVEDWWYFIPETGQHIGFFTSKALQFLATDLSLYFYSDNQYNHILSKHPLTEDPFAATKRSSLGDRLLRRLLPQKWGNLILRQLLSSPFADSYLRHLYPPKPVKRQSLHDSDFEDALTILRNKL